MYKSPIEIPTIPIENIVYKARKYTEELIVQAVANAGVKVDKDELMKALRFDRDQYSRGYEKGFEEGKVAMLKEIEEKK